MKIFRSEQIRAIDAYTIQHEPIASVDLMERAALKCFEFIKAQINKSDKIIVVCGVGNNGGDGLALARMLNEQGYVCEAVLLKFSDKLSTDAELNAVRLKGAYPSCFREIKSSQDLANILKSKYSLVIDAILGTGLNKPINGWLAECIDLLNEQKPIKIISIDVPSGLMVDTPNPNSSGIVKADLVLTFQFPKLAFLLSENAVYANDFVILDIQLHPDAILQEKTNYYYIEDTLVKSILLIRAKFSHKGNHGHALLLAGSKGKSGSAIISAKACLRSGAGLLTVHSQKTTINAILMQLPEAMGSEDAHPDHLSEINNLLKYQAIAFGPGVGLHQDTQTVLKKILQFYSGKLLIDADGLNILSANKTWLSFLPVNSILTPHVKEFDRLTKNHESDFERLETLILFSNRYKCIVILKSAHTAIAMPDGTVFFNSSGNPGLAKAGSGDGLTGMILGLLSRGYNPAQAALIGVYIHGFAADLCLKTMSMESLLISDVIEQLPQAFLVLEQKL